MKSVRHRISLGVIIVALTLSLSAGRALADIPSGRVVTQQELACMGWDELEQLYRQSSPGTAPHGFMRGRVVFRPCDTLAGPRTRVANSVWQGKHFGETCLVNQWKFGRFIKAEILTGESWLDGGPAHILDYQRTSLLWRDVRDEVREVAPGFYVGAMYLRQRCGGRLKLLFVLEPGCHSANSSPSCHPAN